MIDDGLHGLMAEFETPEAILVAALKVRVEGYRAVEAYSPYPVEGLSEAVGFTKSRVPLVVFLGGAAGAASGFLLQYWCAAVDYPLNVGARPLNSIPSWIPIVFELTILFAALAAAIGMFFLNGLPRPYHAVFNVPRFSMSATDRFFIVIEAKDKRFEKKETLGFLETLGAKGVYEVPD